jgi:hypothetical protein
VVIVANEDGSYTASRMVRQQQVLAVPHLAELRPPAEED